MDEEMQALRKNDTWEMEPLPEGKKLIGRVYAIKHNSDGSFVLQMSHCYKDLGQSRTFRYYVQFYFLGYTTETWARSGSKSGEKVCGGMGYMVASQRGGF